MLCGGAIPGHGVAMDMNRAMIPAGVLMLVAAGVAGCGSSSSDSVGPEGECPLVVADAWVKAAEGGMTAAFGTVRTTGSGDEVVESASSPAAGRMEIHEVAEVDGSMVMRPKAGGLVVPAGSDVTLAPGGDHLMLLDLPGPIQPGEQIDITLDCAAGGSATFTAVAKPFEGAEEDYEPSAAAGHAEDTDSQGSGGDSMDSGGSGGQMDSGGSGGQMDSGGGGSSEAAGQG